VSFNRIKYDIHIINFYTLNIIVLQLRNFHFPCSKLKYKYLYEIYCLIVSEENNVIDYKLSFFLQVPNH